MDAHLYKIPSTYRNISDRIIIQAKPREDYPGTWLHGVIHLPEGYQAIDTDYGEGFILTDTDEAITEIYPGKPGEICGDAIREHLVLRGKTGQVLACFAVEWK